jgi:FOG: LysM repeat
MDTISRESSPSYLPIAGLIAGILGVILGGIGLANAAKANKAAAEALAQATEQVDRISDIDSRLSSVASSADAALRNVNSLKASTQDSFNLVATELGKTNGEIAKLQEAASRKAAPAPTKSEAGPVTAGPDEYVVKSGDTGMKIAAANGVSIGALQAVNPGVNWNSLKIGQKLKLPAKR